MGFTLHVSWILDWCQQRGSFPRGPAESFLTEVVAQAGWALPVGHHGTGRPAKGVQGHFAQIPEMAVSQRGRAQGLGHKMASSK